MIKCAFGADSEYPNQPMLLHSMISAYAVFISNSSLDVVCIYATHGVYFSVLYLHVMCLPHILDHVTFVFVKFHLFYCSCILYYYMFYADMNLW